MRVLISHSSKDKPAVEQLACSPHARAIKVRFGKGEIEPGDDTGVVFSIHSRASH